MNSPLAIHRQDNHPSSVSGSPGVTTSRCSSQMARLAEREGIRRPDTQERVDAYEAPSRAPSAATDSCERSRSAESMATASGPVGSDSRDTRSASAPPEANRLPPSVAGSSISETRYGKVESFDRIVMATSSPNSRRRRGAVAGSIGGSHAVGLLDDGLSLLALPIPQRRLPLPDEVVWNALDAFGGRLHDGLHGRDCLLVLRAFATVLGEGNRRAALSLVRALEAANNGGIQ